MNRELERLKNMFRNEMYKDKDIPNILMNKFYVTVFNEDELLTVEEAEFHTLDKNGDYVCRFEDGSLFTLYKETLLLTASVTQRTNIIFKIFQMLKESQDIEIEKEYLFSLLEHYKGLFVIREGNNNE